jgi:hypothetical protein
MSRPVVPRLRFGLNSSREHGVARCENLIWFYHRAELLKKSGNAIAVPDAFAASRT